MSKTKDYKAWLVNMIEDGMQLNEYGSEEDWVMYQDFLRLLENSDMSEVRRLSSDSNLDLPGGCARGRE